MPVEIKFEESSGFVRDAAYSTYLYEVVKENLDGYEGLTEITVQFKETPYLAIGREYSKYQFSEDGRKCKLLFCTHQYYDTKGRITGKPGPASVLRDIKFMVDKLREEHRQQFLKNKK